jgi:hypothetical protein
MGEIKTEDYGREFAVDRGRGAEYPRWTAWHEDRPGVRGYGATEAEAVADLAQVRPGRFVTPANGTLCDCLDWHYPSCRYYAEGESGER